MIVLRHRVMKENDIIGSHAFQDFFGQIPDASVAAIKSAATEIDGIEIQTPKNPMKSGAGNACRRAEGKGYHPQFLQYILRRFDFA